MAVFVTGANRGLGLAVCRALINQGKELIVSARSKQKLTQVFTKRQLNYTDCIELDFASSQHEAFAGLLKQIDRVDSIVHCASLFTLSSIQEANIKDIVDYGRFEINNMILAQWALRHFTNRQGRLVWVGSISATDFNKKALTYSLYKASLMSLSKACNVNGYPSLKSTYIHLGKMSPAPGAPDSVLEADVADRIAALLEEKNVPDFLELQA